MGRLNPICGLLSLPEKIGVLRSPKAQRPPRLLPRIVLELNYNSLARAITFFESGPMLSN